MREAIVFVLFAVACGPARQVDADLTPPFVTACAPSGPGVPVDATFDIRFSEPVRRDRLFWTDPASGNEVPDSVLLVRAADEGRMVVAADSPPLSTSERERTIPASLTLSADRTEVSLRPLQPLDGDAGYVLLVSRRLSDDHFNGLVAPGSPVNETQVFPFTTAAAPDRTPPSVRLDFPLSGARDVPTNTRTVQVRFSEPMPLDSVTVDRIGLTDDAGRRLSPASITWDGTVASLTFATPVAGCAPLCAATTYSLLASPAITDPAGNPLVPVDAAHEFFRTSDCSATAPPVISEASVEVAPTDRSAALSWRTSAPSTSRVRYTAGGADALAACLEAGTCAIADGADADCSVDFCALPSDPALFTCAHRVRLTGLTPGSTYAFAVESASWGLPVARSVPNAFATAPPPPHLAITELFATPRGLTDETGKLAPDRGKFVEIENLDTVPVDLAPTGSGSSRRAWSLVRCADSSCANGWANVWPMRPAGAPTVLAPGAFALAVGAAFDPYTMEVPPATMLLVSDGHASTLLGNGLASSSSYAYALLSPDGLVVSTYAGWLGKPNVPGRQGHSFARVNANGPDSADDWQLGTNELSAAPGNFATPGAPNGPDG